MQWTTSSAHVTLVLLTEQTWNQSCKTFKMKMCYENIVVQTKRPLPQGLIIQHPVLWCMKTQSSLQRTNYSHTVQRKQYKPHLKKPNWCNNWWFLSCISINKCVQIRMGRAKDSRFTCMTLRDISVNSTNHFCMHRTSQYTI